MSTPNSTNAASATKPRSPRPTVEELRDRRLHTDRLWDVADVAACLGFCVRLTEQIVKDPRVPQPRLVSKGGERRWSPSHWLRWMDDKETTYLGEIVDQVMSVLPDGVEMAVI